MQQPNNTKTTLNTEASQYLTFMTEAEYRTEKVII